MSTVNEEKISNENNKNWSIGTQTVESKRISEIKKSPKS